MTLPEGWQVILSPNGLVMAYRPEISHHMRPCGFAMGCIKDDDSLITWDAVAMERDKR
jgi:hypothetical protein